MSEYTECEPTLEVLIPVTKNEAACLPATLESVRDELVRLGKHCGIIVVANCCEGISDEVAKEVFSRPEFSIDLLTNKVIKCETPGKMFAVNDGIDVAKAENLVLIDGDLILDEGSLAWTLDVLSQPGVKVASMHHAPIEDALPEDKELATIIQMNAYRRHAFPEKYWLHGAYLGWRADMKIEGQLMRFPAGKRVHEDNWLTAVLARDYGLESMRVTKNYMARFISPQTWDDYYKQQWRYQFAHEDLAEAFPELAEYIPRIREWTNAKYPAEWINSEWRETCIKNGIDFDNVVDFYYEVLAKVRAGKEESRALLDKNGVWKQQVTTKYNPSEGKMAQ
jgi:glycosyltransferase involved in cell wall biosynthesis